MMFLFFCFVLAYFMIGFPIRIGIVGGRISNTIQSNIRIVRIIRIVQISRKNSLFLRIFGQFHIKIIVFKHFSDFQAE